MHSRTCSAGVRWFLLWLLLLFAGSELTGAPGEAVPDRGFYLPADPKHTLLGDLYAGRIPAQTGLVILRACAKHHYGAYGFLSEGVDWNEHVGQKRHIEQAKHGAIRYTEPFLNNQHITEPTLYCLKHCARKQPAGTATEWLDVEGNRLLLRAPATASQTN